MRPTKTPACGSRSHRVNSPRSPGETRSRIRTTIVRLRIVNFKRLQAPSTDVTLRRVPEEAGSGGILVKGGGGARPRLGHHQGRLDVGDDSLQQPRGEELVATGEAHVPLQQSSGLGDGAEGNGDG